MRCSTHKNKLADWHERLRRKVIPVTSRLEGPGESFAPEITYHITIPSQMVFLHLNLLPEWYRPLGFGTPTKPSGRAPLSRSAPFI
jgi:hypothetical protein